MTVLAASRPSLLRRAIRLEQLTVGWNLVEGVVAVAAGLAAGSVALVGFGVDSAVETVSGAVLLWRLSAEARGTLDEEAVERVERRAERLVGVAFLLLAAYVAVDAVLTLVRGEHPEASPVGIALTAVSIVVMIWLTGQKRRAGEALESRALVADSKQTYACWYLSVTTLTGLGLNALFGWWWADPVAGLGDRRVPAARGRRGAARRGRRELTTTRRSEMTDYTIRSDEDEVAIEITGAGGSQAELLQAFGECQQGQCSCPTNEYEKVDAMNVEPAGDRIAITLRAKPGARFDADEIAACLDYTVGKGERKG